MDSLFCATGATTALSTTERRGLRAVQSGFAARVAQRHRSARGLQLQTCSTRRMDSGRANRFERAMRGGMRPRVERLRCRHRLLEISNDLCRRNDLRRLGLIRPCRGQWIIKRRLKPTIQIILTWERRRRDRGDYSGRTGDRGFGVVGADENSLALRDSLVGLRPCSG